MSVGELIVSIIGDMSKLSETFSKVQTDIGNVGSKLTKTGEGISSVGKGMTAGITAPILAVAAAGVGLVSWASDVSQSQGKMQVSLGLSGAEAKKLEDSAVNVWKNGFGGNLDEVNTTITSVRQNMGDLAGTELENVSSGALTISQTFGEDVNAVTATSGVLMKNFGIDGEHALDLITTGYQKGGNYSGELLDTLREYSPQFQTMGLNAEDFLGILVSGAQAGSWNLDKVGDSVKEFNIRAQDGSTTTAAGFAAIGLDANKMGSSIAAGGDTAKSAFMATVAALSAMKDPIQQNAAGTALFGTQWEDVKKNVISACSAGIGSIKDVTGATAKAGQDLTDANPFSALTSSARELQAQMLPILQNQIIPLIKDDLVPLFTNIFIPALRDYLVPAIALAAEKFGSLSQPMQLAIIAFIAFAAALGPILVIAGAVATGIGALAGLFGAGGTLAVAFAAAQTAIGVVVAALGTIGAPILILVGLVALVAIAWARDWGGIREKTAAVWDWITTAVSNLWNRLEYYYHAMVMGVATLKTNIGTSWDSIKTAISTASASIITTIQGWYASLQARYNQVVALGPWLSAQVQGAYNNLKAAFIAGINTIISTVQTLYSGLQAKYNTIVALGTGLLNSWKTHWSNITSATSSAASTVSSALSGLLSKARSAFNSIISAALGLLNSWKSHWNNLVSATNSAASTVTSALNGLLTKAKTAFNSIVAAALSLLNSWKSHWNNLVSATNSAASSVASALNGLLSKAQSAFNSIIAAANALLTKWKTVWSSLVTTVSGIAGTVVSTISGLASKISGLASSFYNAGAAIIDNLRKGVEAKIQAVKNSITGLLSWISSNMPHSPALMGPLTKLPNFAAYITEPLSKAVSAAKTTALGAGSSIINTIAKGVTSAAKTVYNAAAGALAKVSSLLPHSPAKEGPFKTLPDWDSIFYTPMMESIKNISGLASPLSSALSNIKGPISSSMAAGLQSVSNVSTNNYGGDTLHLEGVTLSNGMDLQTIFVQFEKWTADKRRARGVYR